MSSRSCVERGRRTKISNRFCAMRRFTTSCRVQAGYSTYSKSVFKAEHSKQRLKQMNKSDTDSGNNTRGNCSFVFLLSRFGLQQSFQPALSARTSLSFFLVAPIASLITSSLLLSPCLFLSSSTIVFDQSQSALNHVIACSSNRSLIIFERARTSTVLDVRVSRKTCLKANNMQIKPKEFTKQLCDRFHLFRHFQSLRRSFAFRTSNVQY